MANIDITNNQKLATLLVEAAELLTEETTPASNENTQETLHEGIDVLTGLLISYYVGIVLSAIALISVQKRAAAKQAKAISKEELQEAIKFFNSITERIRTLLKQSSYKKYVEDGIITISDNYPDFTDDKAIKHIAFHITYPVVTINMNKLLHASKKYDESVATEDRFNKWVKNETENLAKVLDKIRTIFHQNSFVKDNFTLVLSPTNETKTVYQMVLVAKQPLVFDSSKYIKNKKDKK